MTSPAQSAGPLTVVVTDGNVKTLSEQLAAALPPGSRIVWLDGAPDAEVVTALGDADAFVGPRFTRQMGAAAQRLRLVQVAGVGLDGVEANALPARATLCNTYHHQDAMAEYVVAAAVLLRRGLLDADRALRANHWASPNYDDAVPIPGGLAEARVGLLGFGHVGERTWQAMRHFGAIGAAVTGSGRLDADAHGLAWAGRSATDKARLFQWADIVVVSIPLSDATRGAVSASELDLLGPDGVLINMARGPVVDEHDLFAALREHRLGAAAIDVWYSYPTKGSDAAPASEPFGELTNTLLTPHVSGVARGTFAGRLGDIVANLNALVSGAPLRNVVPS